MLSMNYKKILRIQEIMMFLLVPILIAFKGSKMLWFIFLLNGFILITLRFHLLIKNEEYSLLKKEILFGALFGVIFFVLYHIKF